MWKWEGKNGRELTTPLTRQSITRLHTIIHVGGATEETWNVLLEHGQRCVQIFQYTDNGILTLDGMFGSFQCTHCVKWPAQKYDERPLRPDTHPSKTYVHEWLCPQKNKLCRRWSPIPSCVSPSLYVHSLSPRKTHVSKSLRNQRGSGSGRSGKACLRST